MKHTRILKKLVFSIMTLALMHSMSGCKTTASLNKTPKVEKEKIFKSIRETTYLVTAGYLEISHKESKTHRIQDFQKFLKPNGEIDETKLHLQEIYTENYNTIGNITDSRHVIPEGDVNSQEEFVYSEKGELMEVLGYSLEDDSQKKTIVYKSVYEKDLERRTFTTTTFDTDGNISSKNLSEYDEEWKILRIHIYGDRETTLLFTYDDNGNLIERCEYNSNGDLQSKHVNVYNALGNLMESYIYGASENLDKKQVYKEGFMEEHVYYFSDLSPTFTTIYNRRGEILEELDNLTYGVGKKMKVVYSYEFDANNNWIKKMESEGYSPRRVVIREFIPYE